MTINLEISDEPDLDALAAIHASCFPKAWSVGDIAQMLSINGSFAVIGEGAFGLLRCIEGEGEILTLAVLPDMRRKGMAKAIVNAMRAWARTHGIDALFLEVRESNKAALSLYRKAGFSEVSRRKDYYSNDDGSREAALMMRCNISG